jgi:predicted small lipoprotein YifL
MKPMNLRRGIAVFLILALAAGLTGCGKKSAMEPPEKGQEQKFPGTYPKN